MVGIATYVFLDLETTGMPREELNKTKITELSMVVVKREHILETRAGVLPRVQPKLTMCFNPGRMINPEATDVTGLDNELLEHETMFDMNVFNTINSFLNCQEKPVCLIAQNGFRFDFPILKNHFVKLNASLNEDIMCADSLYALYELNKTQNSVGNVLHKMYKQINNSINESTALQCIETLNNNISSESNTVLLKNNNGEITRSSSQVDTENVLLISDTEDEEAYSPLSKKRQNERTPSLKRYDATPPITPKTIISVKRKIYFEGDSKPKESFKLKKMYERVLGCRGMKAHRAENDCIMAAELSTSKAEKFVKWIDNNHCAFSEVKPMRLGVPLGD